MPTVLRPARVIAISLGLISARKGSNIGRLPGNDAHCRMIFNLES